jgi:hypothetical protein
MGGSVLFMSWSAWKKTASNLFIRVEASQLSVSVVPVASESTGARPPILILVVDALRL